MNIHDAMVKRRSVRTYTKNPISQEIRQKLTDFMNTVKGPFQTKMRFQIVDLKNVNSDKKLGTYGVIQGASVFIFAAVQ